MACRPLIVRRADHHAELAERHGTVRQPPTLRDVHAGICRPARSGALLLPGDCSRLRPARTAHHCHQDEQRAAHACEP